MQTTTLVYEMVMAVERDRESSRSDRRILMTEARRGQDGRNGTGKRAVQELARTMAGRFASGRLAPRRNMHPALTQGGN